MFCDPENKDLLIDFLNWILPSDRKIDDLQYVTTELSGITLYSKASRLDLRCRDTLGKNFIVEVQNYWQEYFFRRCAYYAARIYSYGAEKGDRQSYDVDPVFMIGLLNTDIGLGRDGEITAFSEGKRAQYDADMITERDHENMMYSAEMKGRREGLAEGKAEGLVEGIAKVAKALLAAGRNTGCTDRLSDRSLRGTGGEIEVGCRTSSSYCFWWRNFLSSCAGRSGSRPAYCRCLMRL